MSLRVLPAEYAESRIIGMPSYWKFWMAKPRA